MNLFDLIIPTAVAAPGMTVGRVFAHCVDAQVPGIPMVNPDGLIIGRASIRYVLKQTCIPDFMVKHSHILGNSISELNISGIRTAEILAMPIDQFVLPDISQISSSSSVAKALAIMEDHDTTYIFVIDDHQYRGVITIMDIAEHMLASNPG